MIVIFSESLYGQSPWQILFREADYMINLVANNLVCADAVWLPDGRSRLLCNLIWIFLLVGVEGTTLCYRDSNRLLGFRDVTLAHEYNTSMCSIWLVLAQIICSHSFGLPHYLDGWLCRWNWYTTRFMWSSCNGSFNWGKYLPPPPTHPTGATAHLTHVMYKTLSNCMSMLFHSQCN